MRTQRMWLWFVCLIASFQSAYALDVPLILQPLAPAGVSTGPRGPEVVAVGIPLSVDDRITRVEQLGLSGSSAAQFRVLARHAGTDYVRWVLATFVAESATGSYALVSGNGAFGGGVLGRETADHIIIATGVAEFAIRKQRFNLIDRATVQGQDLVAPHADGGVLLQSGTVLFASSNDDGTSIVLEENGPVRSVVCARGVLRSTSGDRHCGYTARLYFDRGSARCRAMVTLRNAELASLSSKPFDAAWVEVPVAVGTNSQVDFELESGRVSGTLGASGQAFLFQGDNQHYRAPRTDRVVGALTSARGVEIVINGAQRHASGSTSDVSQGWVRLRDSNHTILAGMRDLATLFPSGLDIRNGRLAVEMFSRHNPRSGLVFNWGAHETREILFDFGSGDTGAFDASLRAPLVARCGFGHYRDTGAIYGERRLVTYAEQQTFFSELGKTWQLNNLGPGDISLERQYSFSTTGGGNQFDHDLCYLVDYLRTGQAGRLEQARLSVLWKADGAVLHSDDFDYGERQNRVSDVDVNQPEGFHGAGAGSVFDDEHPHWVSLPIYYYMTGDEHVRESVEDYCEWRRYKAGNPTYGAIHGGALNHFRLWSRAFRDIALAYEFTGSDRYLNDLRRMATALTQTYEEGTSRGRNLERGYFYFGDEGDAERRIHLFFLTEIHPPAVTQAIRVLPANDPLREELRDYLEGVAWFTLQEAQIDASAIGYPYGYFAAHANTELGTRGDQTGTLLAHGFEMSGRAEFVERARALSWRVLEYQHFLRGSELATHARIFDWLHRNEIGAVLLDPEVQRNTNGSYTLRWTAPSRAREYIVKYGERPLVENLSFDQRTRRYQVDPATAMNFWAAKNVAGEPEAGPVGQQVAYTTPVLPSGNWSFRLRALVGEARPPEDSGPPPPDDPPPGGDPPPVDDPPGDNPPPDGDPPPPDGTPGASETNLLFVYQPPGEDPIQMHYTMGSRQRVRFEIFDVRGRRLRLLDEGVVPAGEHVAEWDRRGEIGRRLGRGVYFIRLAAGSVTVVSKLMLWGP